MKKPQPKYGWHGQVSAQPEQPKSPKGFKPGDRVIHLTNTSVVGTITAGPLLQKGSSVIQWYVRWDGLKLSRLLFERNLRLAK